MMDRRFWSKVLVTDGCLIWQGAVGQKGYGQYRYFKLKRTGAHRYAYEQLVGPIPPGLVIDHLCRNRLCVRPDHLEAVTNAENTRRGLTSALRPERTECANGHPWREGTWRWSQNGKGQRCRVCKRCVREAQIRHLERRQTAGGA